MGVEEAPAFCPDSVIPAYQNRTKMCMAMKRDDVGTLLYKRCKRMSTATTPCVDSNFGEGDLHYCGTIDFWKCECIEDGQSCTACGCTGDDRDGRTDGYLYDNTCT
jgi:hypothetical protein